MIDEARLQKATTYVLRLHLGVAAEFVAQDAMQLLRSAITNAEPTDEARLHIFFTGLNGFLDKTLPARQIREQILKAYSGPHEHQARPPSMRPA